MYQEGCGGFWKKSKYSFFAATVWCSEPLDLQLNHIQKPAKPVVLDVSFWKNEHSDPQFFSHIWNSHKTKDRY